MRDILSVVEDYLNADTASGDHTTPAEPSGELDEQQLLSLLVDTVSQRTGYPPDMLDPDANLEADLGIDSIKRVEIISAFRRQALPWMEEPPAEFMDLVHDPTLASSLGISAPSLEGYLHPETYRIQLDAAPREAIEMMVDETMRLFDRRSVARAESLGMSVHEILTLASIIETEAMLDSERERISAVYHNRLGSGWRLEADPTVRYAIGNFRRRLYYRDLEVDSPYNTYRRGGLPPGPICSPGRASIEAALYPLAGSEEFFFVSNGDGTHTFSETFAEHVRARQRIQQEREAKEFSLDTGQEG